MIERYERLKQTQISRMGQWLHDLPHDRKLTIAGSALAISLIGTAASFVGSQTPMVEYCLVTPKVRLCRYHMALSDWQGDMGKEARSMDAQLGRVIPPTNTYKALESAIACLGFGLATAVFRVLQEDERQITQFQAVEQKRDAAISELLAAHEVQAVALENQLTTQQAELLGDVEFKVLEQDAQDQLFLAETAGMSDDERKQYLEYLKGIQTPYQPRLQGHSLDEINNPSDKVEGENQPVLEDAALQTQPQSESFNPLELTDLNQLPKAFRYLREFVSNTALVLGSQGSGKSWMVRLLAYLKKLRGYRVIVFDPNSNQYEWRGMEFYGSYEAIAGMMDWYVEEVQRLYEAFRQTEMTEEEWRRQLWKQGKTIALICEEYSTYADFIEDAPLLKKFVKTASTLSRKQEAPVTFITHNLTKECLGKVEGVFDIFKRMQRLTLDVQTDPVTDQPVATGTGVMKRVDSDEEITITTPKLSEKIIDFRSEADRLGDTRNRLIEYERMEGITGSDLNPGSDEAEPLNPTSDDDFSNSEPAEPRFTSLGLTRQEAISLINKLRTELTQTQVIERLWSCRKGGSAAWKAAVAQFKDLMGEPDSPR